MKNRSVHQLIIAVLIVAMLVSLVKVIRVPDDKRRVVVVPLPAVYRNSVRAEYDRRAAE